MARCVLAPPPSAGLWGATAPEQEACCCFKEGQLETCVDARLIHIILIKSSCVTLLALEDKIYGAGLCFWLKRVQVQFLG